MFPPRLVRRLVLGPLIDHVIHARWWRVPADQVPRSGDREAQVQWLYGWWETIDGWISARRAADAKTPAPVPGGPDQLPV
jgi:hypothetical protein